MNYSLWFDTINMEWSNVFICHILQIKSYLHVLTKIVFVLHVAINVDTDETAHNVAFHLDIHCMPKFPFRGH